MAPHWKCGSGQPVAGSNPALSAIYARRADAPARFPGTPMRALARSGPRSRTSECARCGPPRPPSPRCPRGHPLRIRGGWQERPRPVADAYAPAGSDSVRADAGEVTSARLRSPGERWARKRAVATGPRWHKRAALSITRSPGANEVHEPSDPARARRPRPRPRSASRSRSHAPISVARRSAVDSRCRARRGTSGALYLQSAPAGLNSHPRSPFSRSRRFERR
jgi:hypothetical protein